MPEEHQGLRILASDSIFLQIYYAVCNTCANTVITPTGFPLMSQKFKICIYIILSALYNPYS